MATSNPETHLSDKGTKRHVDLYSHSHQLTDNSRDLVSIKLPDCNDAGENQHMSPVPHNIPEDINSVNVRRSFQAILYHDSGNFQIRVWGTRAPVFFGYGADSPRNVAGSAHVIAAIRTYEAYEDGIFLEHAIKAWNWGRQFTLSDEDVGAGVIQTKNFTLQKTCDSTSITGGTFGLNSTESSDLDSWTTGDMLVLSFSLYKITSNEIYISSARAIANFIRTHLYVGSSLVVSQLSAGQDDGCQLDQATPAGLFLQGLSLLNVFASSTEYYTAL
ncbi:hypothetical protein VNI00_012186 [Paramarasmius palmivorus]|uniref:Uncharacterized protein n=1 Tax=Paramarasmius palmivorus TaxID=297713 RepID=A0AAW0C5K3_9AGAR